MSSKVRAAFAILTLFAGCSLAACIIGPKQDDPASDDTPAADMDAGGSDTGVAAPPDDGGGLGTDVATAADSGVSGADTSPPSVDARCDDAGDGGDAGCTSDGGDAASDAPTSDADGGTPDVLGGD
ncbi:MAG: hypothetical protein ACXVEF_22385 [Polyangiales bacterium]